MNVLPAMNSDLVFYYVIYRIGMIVLDYLYSMQDYLAALVFPRFIQKVSVDSRYIGITNLEIITGYLAETSGFPVYRNGGHSSVCSTDPAGKDRGHPLATGRHVLVYRGKYIFANVQRSDAGNVQASLTLYALSTDVDFFRSLRKDAHARLDSYCNIYVQISKPERDGECLHIDWYKHKPAPRITFADAVITDENQRALEAAITRYNNQPAREIRLKIPRRLTILLSGPPGFGKSTLINAIAHEMNLNVYATSLSTLSDSALPFIHKQLASNACLVLEDIDTMTCDREVVPAHGFSTHYNRGASTVSLSAFLNILDGVYASDTAIIMMTTNYPEKLDSALIRSERIHLHLKFGPAKCVYERFTRRFYEVNTQSDHEYVNRIIDIAMSRKLSTSDLQSVYRRCEKLEDAIAALS